MREYPIRDILFSFLYPVFLFICLVAEKTIETNGKIRFRVFYCRLNQPICFMFFVFCTLSHFLINQTDPCVLFSDLICALSLIERSADLLKSQSACRMEPSMR